MHEPRTGDGSPELAPTIGDRQFQLAMVGMPMVLIPMAEAIGCAKRDPAMAARAVHVSARVVVWMLMAVGACAAGTMCGMVAGFAVGGGAQGAWVGIAVGSFLPFVLVLLLYFPCSRWLRRRDALGVGFNPVHRLIARSLARIVDGFCRTRIEPMVMANGDG